jgi:hypothetical protein
MNPRSGVAFVVSHIDVDGDLPIQIIDNHIFRAASDSEISLIDSLLAQALPSGSHGLWVHYKSLVKEERYEGRTSYHLEDLPRDKWKYWVIAFEGTNHKVHELEKACMLLNPDIELGFQVYFQEPNQEGDRAGYSMMPLHLVEKYSWPESAWKNAKNITTEELSNIGCYHRSIVDLPEQHGFVQHALSNFSSIRRVPFNSELLVVGYFSIIESLITHAPRLTETLDSINHQIRNKMILLRKRYSRDVQYATYFLDAKEDVLWKKLYGYRSCLAHGNVPDFKKEFQVLKDHSSVSAFLKENIKELILVALREPGFMSDLRNC